MNNVRRRDLRLISEVSPEPEGFFNRANEPSALPPDETAQLDAMIEKCGVRQILRGLKQLLDSRVELDERRLDSRFGRAAQSVEWASAHTYVRDLD